MGIVCTAVVSHQTYVQYGFGGSVPYPILSPSPPPRGREPAGSTHHGCERRKCLHLAARRLRESYWDTAERREHEAILTTTPPSTQGCWMILCRPRRGRQRPLTRTVVHARSLIPWSCTFPECRRIAIHFLSSVRLVLCEPVLSSCVSRDLDCQFALWLCDFISCLLS